MPGAGRFSFWIWDDVFKKQLDKIYKDAYDETDNIREDIKEIVPTYQGVK